MITNMIMPRMRMHMTMIMATRPGMPMLTNRGMPAIPILTATLMRSVPTA
jgi:hypothetical protein